MKNPFLSNSNKLGILNLIYINQTIRTNKSLKQMTLELSIQLVRLVDPKRWWFRTFWCTFVLPFLWRKKKKKKYFQMTWVAYRLKWSRIFSSQTVSGKFPTQRCRVSRTILPELLHGGDSGRPPELHMCYFRYMVTALNNIVVFLIRK